jgi:hypothetical protein
MHQSPIGVIFAATPFHQLHGLWLGVILALEHLFFHAIFLLLFLLLFFFIPYFRAIKQSNCTKRAKYLETAGASSSSTHGGVAGGGGASAAVLTRLPLNASIHQCLVHAVFCESLVLRKRSGA